MTEQSYPAFDLEQVYDEKIAPLMSQIIAICKAHAMPFVASFHYATDEEKRSFCTTALPFDDKRGKYAFSRAVHEIRSARSCEILAITVTTKGGSDDSTH